MLSTLKNRKFDYNFTGIILIFMMFASYCSYGQDTAAVKQENVVASKLTITIPDSVLKVNNKDLKDITVHVKNNELTPFKGYIYFHSAKGAKIATKDSVAVNLEPGKETFVPSKIYVNQGTQEGIIPVGIALRSTDGTTLDTLTLKLFLAPSRLLTASLDAEDMVLPRPGSFINIPIRITNRGNIREGGVLVIAFPAALKDKTNKSITFELDPFKDTIITFQRKVTREMSRLGVMNVTINGIYNDGNIFAASLITFQDLSSKRSFDQGNGENNIFHNNLIGVGVQNAFDAGETYNVRARGLYSIKDGEVGFNFNMLKWKEGSQALSINSTNLDLAYKRVGVRLGNVTQNGDISFTGRGGEVYGYADSAHRNKFFAGYLDKSINLYTTETYQSSYGNATWAGYKYEKQNLLSLNTYVHDDDRVGQIRNDLFVSNLTWKSSEHFSADTKLGLANSVSTSANKESHPSLALGFNFYSSFFDKLSITGNNAFATAYYPGARRGTLYLNEGAFLRIDKSTLSANLIYSNSEPKYFNQFNQVLSSKNENTTLELTYSLTKGAFSLAFSPQFYSETGNWYYNGAAQKGEMTSARLSTLFTFNPVKVQQTFYLKTDVGAYQTNFINGSKVQFRSMLTYSYRNFRLIGNIQKGNFFMAEVFQEIFAQYNAFRLNIAPSFTTFLLNKNLKIDAGVGYNKDYYSNSFLFNGNFVYTVGPVALFTNLQYNLYSSNRTYKNIQFGLNYYLPDNKTDNSVNKGKIELFVFYDLNRNGTYETGDSVAEGMVVHIGKTIMMSGKDGKIVYNKLPAGNYSIFMSTQNGWYGRDNFVALKEKETRKFSIPLSQTGTIHGNITYQFDSTYSLSVSRDKAWQSIVAINQEGLRFDTKTDENGNYNLYLPVGTYTINVENLPNQIELLLKNNNVQPLKVDAGQIINGVDFILKVKQRKVEIKKFGQQK